MQRYYEYTCDKYILSTQRYHRDTKYLPYEMDRIRSFYPTYNQSMCQLESWHIHIYTNRGEGLLNALSTAVRAVPATARWVS